MSSVICESCKKTTEVIPERVTPYYCNTCRRDMVPNPEPSEAVSVGSPGGTYRMEKEPAKCNCPETKLHGGETAVCPTCKKQKNEAGTSWCSNAFHKAEPPKATIDGTRMKLCPNLHGEIWAHPTQLPVLIESIDQLTDPNDAARKLLEPQVPEWFERLKCDLVEAGQCETPVTQRTKVACNFAAERVEECLRTHVSMTTQEQQELIREVAGRLRKAGG